MPKKSVRRITTVSLEGLEGWIETLSRFEHEQTTFYVAPGSGLHAVLRKCHKAITGLQEDVSLLRAERDDLRQKYERSLEL